jgi:UDP-N-acetylglucosamine transferase subunit ALG13
MQEFPFVTYFDLPGYDLRYGKKRWLTLVKILLTLPKILIRIKHENRWLQAFLRHHRVNAIISDNRFGLYTSKVPAIFITHQLHIKTGLGSVANNIAQRLNYRSIKKFSQCWVPDYKGSRSVAGQLSNPDKLPGIPVHYTGILSRFTPCEHSIGQKKILIILSGPEPQRTIFENMLLRDPGHYREKIIMVRGLPGNDGGFLSPNGITMFNYANSAQLNKLICDADIIISRSGYTTVMDVLKLRKKSILVPTPGQPEQEYLGTYLHEKKLAWSVPQKDFSLPNALSAIEQFSFSYRDDPMEEYKTIVRDFVQSLNRQK